MFSSCEISLEDEARTLIHQIRDVLAARQVINELETRWWPGEASSYVILIISRLNEHCVRGQLTKRAKYGVWRRTWCLFKRHEHVTGTREVDHAKYIRDIGRRHL